jgi:hypothetical protein
MGLAQLLTLLILLPTLFRVWVLIPTWYHRARFRFFFLSQPFQPTGLHPAADSSSTHLRPPASLPSPRRAALPWAAAPVGARPSLPGPPPLRGRHSPVPRLRRPAWRRGRPFARGRATLCRDQRSRPRAGSRPRHRDPAPGAPAPPTNAPGRARAAAPAPRPSARCPSPELPRLAPSPTRLRPLL